MMIAITEYDSMHKFVYSESMQCVRRKHNLFHYQLCHAQQPAAHYTYELIADI